MRLDEVNRGIRKNKKRKRVGRGPGSGHGKTCGRGEKGQKSRAGWSQHPTFQGGAMPMVRRIPKRGFNNRWALVVATVNVKDLETNFDAGDEVTPESLREHSLAKGRYDLLKVLGNGELTKSLTVSAHRFSKTAAEKIEKAGGKVVVLPGKTPVAEKVRQKKAGQGSENESA
jgi:large subunit ribosomal protein L15